MTVVVPPEKSVLAVYTWEAGRRLFRVADDQFGATEFNPGLGGPTRFAPLVVDGKCVPTLYAAATLDAVLDRPDGEPPEIYLSDLTPVRRSTIMARRDLRLGRLDDDALGTLGLHRDQLIDTDADSYPGTVGWAEHAHRYGAAGNKPLDGLVWHSRRAAQGLGGRDLVLVLFGDRVARKDLRTSATPVPLLAAAGLGELDAIANRLGVTLVR